MLFSQLQVNSPLLGQQTVHYLANLDFHFHDKKVEVRNTGVKWLQICTIMYPELSKLQNRS